MSAQFTSHVPCASRALVRWVLTALAVTLGSLGIFVYSAATAAGQDAPPDPVGTVTEAENVPREAELSPNDARPLEVPKKAQPAAAQSDQPLAAPTKEQGTTAGAMTAPPARIDFRRFGVKFSDAGAQVQPTPADQARPSALTIAKVRVPSAASTLGFKTGDQIISIGGEQVATTGQIGQALEKALRAGPREKHVAIPVVVRRAGAEQTLTVSNSEFTMAGYGPLLTEFGHYVPPQYVTGYRGAISDPNIPVDPAGAYLGVVLDSQYPNTAIVSRVMPGTPAAQAGLQAGDRIFAVNNRPVQSPNELVYWVGQMQPGDTIEISFDRANDVDVTLGTRSQHASEAPAAGGNAPAPSK